MKHFIKKKEDFTCINCGKKVKGTGYTNHCPNCLYSLHVDEEVPGDRKARCKGIMEPVKIDMKEGIYYILHRCLRCGKEIRNKVTGKDNFSEVLKISVLSPRKADKK